VGEPELGDDTTTLYKPPETLVVCILFSVSHTVGRSKC